MSVASQRRNPLRLIVNKETQLRILWLVWGALLFCMGTAVFVARTCPDGVWIVALLVAIGTFVSIWLSRKIAGPLYRIEKDLELMLDGSTKGARVHLRDGDPLQHLADMVNQLGDRNKN